MVKRILAVLILLMLVSCTGEEERLKVNRDIANLQEQIYDIERSQAEVARDVDKAVNRLNVKLDDRRNQANIQEQVNALKETVEQIKARVEDLDTALNNLSKAKAEVQTAPIEPLPGSEEVPLESVSGKVVEQQFRRALLDYQRAKFDVAKLGFEGILSSFPSSPYSEACVYYLGRCASEQGDFSAAVGHFQKVIKDFPDGEYTRQSLLYEGQCYHHLNQYSKSIMTLSSLIEKFPGTQEADLATQFLKKAGFQR